MKNLGIPGAPRPSAAGVSGGPCPPYSRMQRRSVMLQNPGSRRLFLIVLVCAGWVSTYFLHSDMEFTSWLIAVGAFLAGCQKRYAGRYKIRWISLSFGAGGIALIVTALVERIPAVSGFDRLSGSLLGLALYVLFALIYSYAGRLVEARNYAWLSSPRTGESTPADQRDERLFILGLASVCVVATLVMLIAALFTNK